MYKYLYLMVLGLLISCSTPEERLSSAYTVCTDCQLIGRTKAGVGGSTEHFLFQDTISLSLIHVSVSDDSKIFGTSYFPNKLIICE